MKNIYNIFRKKPAAQTVEDEFRKLIYSFPEPIVSPSHNYSHTDLIERFERILSGELDVIYMTTAHGLRDK
ncbi:MAG TPA: hypothetical protein DDY21_04245 [Candidatus Moranbacteria bacterium]|nr:hypothetical protein [Candidatus Moranbacteria bacterium]HCO99733.1 hypothetical protein [Candidatus Moranbacteria bacterium]